jgi:hypothetical protein
MFKKALTACAAVLAMATTGAAIPMAASASVRGCNVPAEQYGPHDDSSMNIYNMTVRNMRCSTALTAIKNGWLYYYYGGQPRFHTSGYYCYVTRTWQSGGTVLGQETRCVRGGSVFRWSWAT